MTDLMVKEEFIPSTEIIKDIIHENIGRPLELRDLEKWSIDGTNFVSSFDAQTQEIECIILAKRYEKRYYSDKETLNTPPDCYSHDMKQGIGNPGMLCEECPHNVFVDKKGKECRDRAEIVFIKKGDMIPSKINIPTKSISELKTYLLKLTAKGKFFKDMVTKMTLKRDKNPEGKTYSIVQFEAIGRIEGHSDALKSLTISDI